jgi:hypothetical protein
LVLYHDVYLNKLNFACAVVCSCWMFTSWSFSLNPLFSITLHEQNIKYLNMSWFVKLCIFRKLYEYMFT